jgi:broad specificity phosphatase PhoE
MRGFVLPGCGAAFFIRASTCHSRTLSGSPERGGQRRREAGIGHHGSVARVLIDSVLSRAVSAFAVVSMVAALALPAGEAADSPLGDQLRRGGVVLVIRHAATDFSKPDQDPVDLKDCSTQRNLSAEGRRDARRIGQGARRLQLRIGAVLSSPFCRTRETATLAFGRATVSSALLNTITTDHDAVWRRQIRAARRLLGSKPPAGRVTVLVTHGSVVGDATGHTLLEGETLVFRPFGGGRFRLVGRILPREWTAL